MRHRALLVAWFLACGSAELDLAKAVVEAEGHEDRQRTELSRLERDVARLDADLAAARKALALTTGERAALEKDLARLADEKTALETKLAAQRAAVSEAEVAARKARIQSKQ